VTKVLATVALVAASLALVAASGGSGSGPSVTEQRWNGCRVVWAVSGGFEEQS
jgi:hypothetical protein